MKTYEECMALADERDDHYSMNGKHSIVYELAAPLLSSAERPVALEIGVCHGKTAAMLMAMGFKYYGIDDFSLEGSAFSIRSWIASKGFDGTIIQSKSSAADWRWPLDLLLIDGGHDEANVRPDIEKYLPLLKSGGTAIFDDYDDPYDPNSPHWAIRYYADRATEGWPVLRRQHSIFSARKP